MSKTLKTLLTVTLVITGVYLFLKFSPSATSFIWQISDGGNRLLPLVIVSAVLDSINPCAFSIMLLTVGFLFGLGQSRGQIIKLGGVYIAGIFMAYLAIGLGILQTLHLFSSSHFMGKLGALIMLAFGLLAIINVLFPKFPLRLKVPSVSHHRMALLLEKGSVPALFLLGALVGLCEFPCTGGPYLAVLALLKVKETLVSGLSLLLLYNLVFILPLLVILALSANRQIVTKIREWQSQNSGGIKLWGGVIMVVLAILILKYFV